MPTSRLAFRTRHQRWRESSRRIVGLLLGVAVGSSGCQRPEVADTSVVEEEILPVSIAQATRQEVLEVVRGESTIRPFRQVRVVAEHMGRVETLAVDVGDSVERGALLARLLNKDLNLQIASAADTFRLQEKELEAARPLYEQGFLARQSFEQLELSALQARNTLDRLRTQQAEQQIRAPMAGVVLSRDVELGQQISAGAFLFEIADLSDLRLRIPVPERALRVLREGQEVRVEFTALGDVDVLGRVERIFPQVDASSGTLEVEIRLENEALEQGIRILPGMYARAHIETRRRQNVLVVPRQVLLEEGGERSLFVLDAAPDVSATAESTGRVSQRVIQTGWEGDGLVEVIEGLSEEDYFVRVGQNRLRQGAQVRIIGDRP